MIICLRVIIIVHFLFLSYDMEWCILIFCFFHTSYQRNLTCFLYPRDNFITNNLVDVIF